MKCISQMKVLHYFTFFLFLLFLFPDKTFAQDSYRVTAQRLNVRNKPSTQALVVGVLNLDEIISVIEISNGWATFSFKGNVRYVNASFLEKVVDSKDQKKTKEVESTKPTKKKEENIPPSVVQTPKKKKHRNSFIPKDGEISLLVDAFGGYSNFICDEVSPECGLGFGADIGVQFDYNRLWGRMPKGIFGELTAGYSCRGSGAFPLHCAGMRVLPLGYKYEIGSSLFIAAKAGMYLAYPFSGISTKQNSYDGNFDYGLSIALGIEWKRIGLMASYEHGFADVIDGARVDLFNQGAFLTLSFKFLTLK